MKGGTQAALALGVGYMLGRRHKLRKAAIFAAVTATGRSGGLSKALIGRGLKSLESTELAGTLAPQLGEIANTARSDLVDAGKTAAIAVVSNRVDSLSDALHSRAEVLRDPAAAGTSIADVLRGSTRDKRAEGSPRGAPGSARRHDPDGERDESQGGRGERDDDRYEDEYETDDSGFQDEDEDAYDDYEPGEEDERPDGYEPDDEDEPDGGARRAPASGRRPDLISSPVSRSGR